ncbi:hypothetical protein GCM10023213_16170 [Prosthecobacter algae]|uniref:Uncharacterized protein n=1 Tax=Prosthecobacter algae TaxID=1144682 RepID=A0ABP9P040_9BACT
MIEKYNFTVFAGSGDALTPEVSPEAFARIRQGIPDLIPEGATYLPMHPTPTDDPRVLRVLEALQQAGYDLTDREPLQKAGIHIRRTREYQPADLTNQEYVQPHLHLYVGEPLYPQTYDDAGVPHLKAPITPKSRECGMLSNTSAMLVRGKVKAALEKSGLTGLRLARPVVTGKKPVPESEMAWVVWSDMTLPPMLNLCKSGRDLYRYDPATARPRECLPYQGFLSPAEMHYRRSDMLAAGAPDVGITLEKLGGGSTMHRILFSRRCVAFFRDELGISLDGQPVRLVDGSNPPIPWVGVLPDPQDPRNQRPAWLQAMV